MLTSWKGIFVSNLVGPDIGPFNLIFFSVQCSVCVSARRTFLRINKYLYHQETQKNWLESSLLDLCSLYHSQEESGFSP